MERLPRLLIPATGPFELTRILNISHTYEIPFDYIVVDVLNVAITTKSRIVPDSVPYLYGLMLFATDASIATHYLANPMLKDNMAFFHITHQLNFRSSHLKLIHSALAKICDEHEMILHPTVFPLYMIAVNHALSDPSGAWESAGSDFKYGVYLSSDALEHLLLPALFYSWLLVAAGRSN